MTRGEKLFYGTVAAITVAGGPTGYIIGGELNDTPKETIQDRKGAVATAQHEVETTVKLMPECEQTVIGTVDKLPEKPYNLDIASIAISQCGETATPHMENYSSAVTKLNEANNNFNAAQDSSDYSFREKTLSIAGGLGYGWWVGWGLAAIGAAIVSKYKD